ncbi:hypothetical protein [Streptomyces sp. NPDC096323]|uniref:hypothetical protein n=1 Tax=Streptomyces sp. NPDC096323 TaxID=3155822 RepID=UPI0033260A82
MTGQPVAPGSSAMARLRRKPPRQLPRWLWPHNLGGHQAPEIAAAFVARLNPTPSARAVQDLLLLTSELVTAPACRSRHRRVVRHG